jgi:hypothetical protein
MGGKNNKNKGSDRARNYAIEVAQQTDPIWQNMISKGTQTSSPDYDPTQNSVFQWAQNQLGGVTTPQAIGETDLFKQLQGLYAPWQSTDYTAQPIYQQMNDLYTQQAQPLYGQMLDPLKRNLENQYQTAIQQIMASMPRGGAMASNLANAALGRAQGASDLEKQLRTQDILRQDTLNQQKTGALANVLAGLEGTRQNVASQLGNAAIGIDQNQSAQQLQANQLLTALLSSIYGQDQQAANALGMYGQNSLQGILNQQSAAAQQAQSQQNAGLTQMMSTLGLGAGLIGGGMIGGPAGAAVGGKVGGNLLTEGFWGQNVGANSPYGTFGR